MKNLRQVFLGFIIALASLGLILGGFSLSLAEGNLTTTQAPADTLVPTTPATLQPTTPATLQPTTPATLQPTTPPADSPTPSPTATPTRILTRTPTWTPSRTPTGTICSLPVGWVYYVVQTGDTLDHIGAYYNISSAELQQANCLLTTVLVPGSGIYVPPSATQPAALQCGPPYNWVMYIVQPQDTLYYLSRVYGVSVAELQRANCLGSSTLLHVGQGIYVPPWAPIMPSPTSPWFEIPTNTPEITPPSDTPTETPPGLPVETPTETPTIPPTETPGWTPLYTWTSVPGP